MAGGQLASTAAQLCAAGGGHIAQLTRWQCLSMAEMHALTAARTGIVGGPVVAPRGDTLLAHALCFVAEATHAKTGAQLQLLLRIHADHPRTRAHVLAHWLKPPPSVVLPPLNGALLRLCTASDGRPASRGAVRCDNQLLALEAGLSERLGRVEQPDGLLAAIGW